MEGIKDGVPSIMVSESRHDWSDYITSINKLYNCVGIRRLSNMGRFLYIVT